MALVARAHCRTLPAAVLAGVVLCWAARPSPAESVVRFDTALGAFDVLLYDTDTPRTVANFLKYVADGDYADSFFHRLVSGSVLQGGGFAFYPDEYGQDAFRCVPTDPPIVNEFHQSNIRGTIAMAKSPGDPDSATSQFFFNLADNSLDLDHQDGGFTVFGEVLGKGMSVVDALAGQGTWDGSGIHPALSDCPLIDHSTGQVLGRQHLVMVNSITLLPGAGPIPGDADYDGYVGLSDLVALARNWNQGPALWGGGDFDGNDNVDLTDLVILARNWHRGTPPVTETAIVREPEALARLGVGALALLLQRRRRPRP